MIISKQNMLTVMCLFHRAVSILAGPISYVGEQLMKVGNSRQRPHSLDAPSLMHDKLGLYQRTIQQALSQYADDDPIFRTPEKSRERYRIQRSCIKAVIGDLNSLSEVIRPQIEENDVCGQMNELNTLAEQKLGVTLKAISPSNCLKFCDDTQRQLNENKDILTFSNNYFEFQKEVMERNQPTQADLTPYREVIDVKQQAIRQTLHHIQQLDQECNSVLDNEGRNIASSRELKQNFDRDCLPHFMGSIHYPTFPTTLDIAYDGVSRHRANLINTCREMLVEHIELAQTEIWQKKSTGQGAVDFQDLRGQR